MKTIFLLFVLGFPGIGPIQDLGTDESLEELIGQLGDKKFITRENASEALVKMGERLLPYLRKVAASSPGPEVEARLKEIIREILIDPVARKLLQRIQSGRWGWYDQVDRRPEFRDEFVIKVSREVGKNPKLLESYRQMVDPNRSGNFWPELRMAVATLKESGAVFSLASGLYHSQYLIQLECAKALAESGDLSVIPIFFDIARGLGYDVMGSKSATVHGFRQSGIAKAIDSILGTSAWKAGDTGAADLHSALIIWEKAFAELSGQD